MQVQRLAHLGFADTHVPGQEAYHAWVQLAGEAVQGQHLCRKPSHTGQSAVEQEFKGHFDGFVEALGRSHRIVQDHVMQRCRILGPNVLEGSVHLQFVHVQWDFVVLPEPLCHVANGEWAAGVTRI